MRHEDHEITKNVHELRIRLRLRHHIATSEEERGDDDLGWEVTELSFTLNPEFIDEGGSRSFSLRQPVTHIEYIRRWFMRLELQPILDMLALFRASVTDFENHLAAWSRAKLAISRELVELDKIPSYPFKD